MGRSGSWNWAYWRSYPAVIPKNAMVWMANIFVHTHMYIYIYIYVLFPLSTFTITLSQEHISTFTITLSILCSEGTFQDVILWSRGNVIALPQALQNMLASQLRKAAFATDICNGPRNNWMKLQHRSVWTSNNQKMVSLLHLSDAARSAFENVDAVDISIEHPSFACSPEKVSFSAPPDYLSLSTW